MRMSIRISLGLLISLGISACSLNRAASLRMLDERAQYEGLPPLPELKEGGLEGFRGRPIPSRTRTRVAMVRVHPHELPNHDYFWGGWISILVDRDTWVLTRPRKMPKAKAVTPKEEKEVK